MNIGKYNKLSNSVNTYSINIKFKIKLKRSSSRE